jgi:hypothetical protein
MPPPNNITKQDSDYLSQSRSPRSIDNMARSGVPPRLRNDGRFCWDPLDPATDGTESWVEIASQPSSSSLSSIGDEIVTTGLRVQHDPHTRRRRRVAGPSHISLEAQQTTSSQEEYEESESDEDRVMTSSNERIVPAATLPRVEYDAGSDSDGDDENATALGRRTDAGPMFTPQPNAFSHPPRQGESYFPSPANSRPPWPPRPTRQHSSYNNQADHDAALRASLTTLLSIGAAAARGLPKREERNTVSHEPMGLRLVPESELMGPNPANTSRPLTPSTRARSSPSISSQEAAEKGKRKANTLRPTTEKVRASKKKRVQVEEDSLLSPTSLFWAMSAGVVVLVFGAGFVIGREVGRQEAMAGLNGSTLVDSGSCGREVARSSTGALRRFKWGIGSGSGILA